MRRLVLVYEDAVFDVLQASKKKTGLTWERFILSKCVGKKVGK